MQVVLLHAHACRSCYVSLVPRLHSCWEARAGWGTRLGEGPLSGCKLILKQGGGAVVRFWGARPHLWAQDIGELSLVDFKFVWMYGLARDNAFLCLPGATWLRLEQSSYSYNMLLITVVTVSIGYTALTQPNHTLTILYSLWMETCH